MLLFYCTYISKNTHIKPSVWPDFRINPDNLMILWEGQKLNSQNYCQLKHATFTTLPFQPNFLSLISTKNVLQLQKKLEYQEEEKNKTVHDCKGKNIGFCVICFIIILYLVKISKMYGTLLFGCGLNQSRSPWIQKCPTSWIESF